MVSVHRDLDRCYCICTCIVIYPPPFCISSAIISFKPPCGVIDIRWPFSCQSKEPNKIITNWVRWVSIDVLYISSTMVSTEPCCGIDVRWPSSVCFVATNCCLLSTPCQVLLAVSIYFTESKYQHLREASMKLYLRHLSFYRSVYPLIRDRVIRSYCCMSIDKQSRLIPLQFYFYLVQPDLFQARLLSSSTN